MCSRLVLLTFLLLPTICFGQKSKSVLFVGNSFTYYNNLPDLISQIAASDGHDFSYKKHTPGGSSFSSHVADTSWRILLRENSFDYFILQGQSAELSSNYQNVGKHIQPNYCEAEYLHMLSQLKDSCTQTLFFMTWGYQFTDFQRYLSMQDNISASYLELAKTLNVALAPVGEAWRSVLKNYTNLSLHSSDGSHPNIAGSYLAACVFYTSIFKETPVGSWHPNTITASDALILQKTAFETVMDDLSNWNLTLSDPSCTKAPLEHNNELWEECKTQNDQFFEKIQFPTEETGYAKSISPYMLYASHDQGATWDSLKIPPTQNEYVDFDFHFVTDSIGFIACSSSPMDSTIIDSNGSFNHFIYPHIYKTMNRGVSWEALPLDTGVLRIKDFRNHSWRQFPINIKIHFDSENVGAVVYFYPYTLGDTVFSLRTTTGGLQWDFSKNKLPEVHPRPTFISADTAFVSTSKQNADTTLQLWRTVDGGANWDSYKEIDFNCCETFRNLQYVNIIHPTKERLMIANNLNTPWLLQTDGLNAKWDTLALSPFIGRLEDFTEVGENKLYAIFENEVSHRIAISKDQGKTWQLDSYHDVELKALTHTNKYIYAAGANGTILRRKLSPNQPVYSPVTNAEGIHVFPNPADGNINFQLPADYTSFPMKVFIINIGGKILDQLLLSERTTSYPTSSLPKGMYFYRAVSLGPIKDYDQGKFIVR